ncbi:MAG: vWA domain-containing protein [Coriobacteriales bacterium]|jgi:Mg-chelatase subunit ChlD
MSTRCAQAQLAQGAATSDARRSPGLPWLRLFVLVVTALSVVALATFTAARGAMAAEPTEDAASDAASTAPATSKTLTDNGDGTYTLSLSVTGESQSSSSSRGANVIIIMDTSGSMGYSSGTGTFTEASTGAYGVVDGEYVQLYRRVGWGYTPATDGYSGTVYYQNANGYYYTYSGTRYSGTLWTRLDVAKSTTNGLIDSLLANNTTADPSRVEISLITFSNSASTQANWSTSASTLQSYVDDMTASGGTNWDDALHAAREIAVSKATSDDDPTYVIFVSDGLPTFYMGSVYGSESSYIHTHGSNRQGSGSDTTWREMAAAKDEASAIISAGYSLYSVGAFGDVSNMQELGGTYYDASDPEALQKAFDEIAQEISNSMSYEGGLPHRRPHDVHLHRGERRRLRLHVHQDGRAGHHLCLVGRPGGDL